MAFDRPGRKIIKRDCIAITAAAIGLRWIGRDHARKWVGDLGSRQQRRLYRPAWPRGMSVAPDRMPPIDYFVVRVEVGLDLDCHCRTEWRVGHLICARPLHADGP